MPAETSARKLQRNTVEVRAQGKGTVQDVLLLRNARRHFGEAVRRASGRQAEGKLQRDTEGKDGEQARRLRNCPELAGAPR